MSWREIGEEYLESVNAEAEARSALQKQRRASQEEAIRQRRVVQPSMDVKEEQGIEMIVTDSIGSEVELQKLLDYLGVDEMLTTMRDEVWGAGEIVTYVWETVMQLSEKKARLDPYVKKSLIAKLNEDEVIQSLNVYAYWSKVGEPIINVTRELYDDNPNLAVKEGRVFAPKLRAYDLDAKKKLERIFAEDMFLRGGKYNKYPLPYGAVAKVE